MTHLMHDRPYGTNASMRGSQQARANADTLSNSGPNASAMGVTVLAGASSGLGRQIATRLAAQGVYIVALARRREPLDELIREIEAGGGRAYAFTCDVTDREEVSRVVASVESTIGPIERLVSCTGGAKPSTIDGYKAALVEQMLSRNLMGIANCLEFVLPRMLQRQCGHIVAISSLAAARGIPGFAEYSAAKAALSTLLEGLRVDLVPRGIDVTILSPGFVRKQGKKSRSMEVPFDVAAARMVKAIERRSKDDSFPFPLVLFLTFLRCLPTTLADKVVRAVMPRSQIARHNDDFSSSGSGGDGSNTHL